MTARDSQDVAALRAPPHSQEAEEAVLGGLMLDAGAWPKVADVITGSDFYSAARREIFEAIAAMARAGNLVDIVTTHAELERHQRSDEVGGLRYLNAVSQSVASANGIRMYAEIVRDRALQRQLIAKLDEAMAIAWGTEKLDVKVDRVTALVGAVQRAPSRSAGRPIAEIATQQMQHYANLEAGNVAPGWPTRVPAVDLMLNGGLQPGMLFILAARPSVGKTSFAWALTAVFGGDGLPVLFISMEMRDNEIADRAVSRAGGVSYSALRSARLDADGWSRASNALERLAHLPITVDDEGELTLAAIRAKAKSVPGLRVLVVDYLQLMKTTRRDGNRNAEVEEISRGLKSLAKELGIAVIALSQLNREVEKRTDKRPNLSDLRDSGALEQDADVVAFMWLVREFESEGRKIVGLSIAKNRAGRTGEIGLDFHGDTQRWGESTADIRHAPRSRTDDL